MTNLRKAETLAAHLSKLNNMDMRVYQTSATHFSVLNSATKPELGSVLVSIWRNGKSVAQ